MTLVYTPGSRQVEVLEVTPAAQTSTNTETVITGAEADLRPWSVLSVTMAVVTNDVTVNIYGANASDFTDEVQVDTSAISAGAVDTYVVQNPPYAYYRVKIDSTVNDTHGDVTVRMFGR